MSKSLFKQNISIPKRRFGRTEISMPILSLGGMRFQQSWQDLELTQIKDNNQKLLEVIIEESINLGLHHFETARHYGSSERQLGLALKKTYDPKRILQTKIPPNNDPKEFERELALSFKRLGCNRLDLLAIHGINLPEHLDQTLRAGGCLEVARTWQKNGFIGNIGFSTHAKPELIVKAIESDEFDYVNLHWYFIRQDNDVALDAAAKLDLGVFIISPTDKGGHLHTPSSLLLQLCDPIHPIIFNDLFCLRDERVHTISIGLETIEDLDLHLEAISLLDRANQLTSSIETRLKDKANSSLGELWVSTWGEGLPSWEDTPGGINIPVLLWLNNLVESWDMDSFAKDRYGMLGRGGHWFPGNNADSLDVNVTEESLIKALVHSPWASEIPSILRKLRARCRGEIRDRLWGI